jgi:hypothetical protein
MILVGASVTPVGVEGPCIQGLRANGCKRVIIWLTAARRTGQRVSPV